MEMKLILLSLLLVVILISGCANLKTEKSQANTSLSKSPVITQQSSPSPALKSPEVKQESPAKTGPSVSPAQEPITEAYDNYPTVSGSLTPSNPSLGDVFKLTIKSDDFEGIKKISWTSSKPLSGSSSDSFDCKLQKTCSYTWDFISSEEGANQFTVITIDSSGKEGKFTLDLNVGPARLSTPSASPSPTVTAQSSPTTQASSGCNSNSDCGYKKICTGGVCQAVDCTSDSHCTGCKRCSSNRCVSCGSGPYGCYC